MGYWEPHSSSVDFCEPNYLLSDIVVETHNVWSSIVGLCGFGLLGFIAGNPTKEIMFSVPYVVLIIIGLGSAGLHGTLHWIFQSSDELPMIYFVLSLGYLCVEVDTPPGKSKYKWLPLITAALALINTIIYYAFQHLYIIFLLNFALFATIAVVWANVIVWGRPSKIKGTRTSAQSIALLGVIEFYGFSFPLWLFDMLVCEPIKSISEQLPGPFLGMTPHVVWHFGSGLGGYCLVLALCSCRLDSLGIEYKVSYLLGIIPYIASPEPRFSVGR